MHIILEHLFESFEQVIRSFVIMQKWNWFHSHGWEMNENQLRTDWRLPSRMSAKQKEKLQNCREMRDIGSVTTRSIGEQTMTEKRSSNKNSELVVITAAAAAAATLCKSRI